MRQLSVCVLLMMGTLGSAFAQEPGGTSTITLGAGGGWLVKNPFGGSSGPAVDIGYEYRISRHWAFDTGLEATFFPATYRSASILAGTNLIEYTSLGVSKKETEHSELLPFGARYISPVLKGRGELFIGGGGAGIWSGSPVSRDAFALQASTGGRISLDKEKHIWLGTTVRFSREIDTASQSWITWTADLSYRFGH